MTAFREAAVNRFRCRVVADIKAREQVDGEGEDDAALRSFVDEAMNWALDNGLTTQRNLFAFVLCARKYGKDFAVHDPTFRAVFAEHRGNEAILGKYVRLASD